MLPAQYDLAIMYYTGDIAMQDNELALFWLQQSASQNFIPAREAFLGMYLRGEVMENLKLVFNLAQQQAQWGDPVAQGILADMYRKGEGTTRDLIKAAFWYKRSAERGYSLSQYDLAMMYLKGEGITQDCERASFWFKMSALQDYAPAQEFLEENFYSGNCE